MEYLERRGRVNAVEEKVEGSTELILLYVLSPDAGRRKMLLLMRNKTDENIRCNMFRHLT